MRTLSVMIATHGRPEFLSATLDSIRRGNRPQGFCGVLVIENGAKSGAVEVVEQYGPELSCRYKYVDQANKSLALNCGLTECDSDYILFLDDDVLISPDILSQYARAANDFPSNVFFGGPTKAIFEEAPADQWYPFMTASTLGWSAGSTDCFLRGQSRFLGFNWSCSRESLLRIGGFDERYGPGAERGATGQESDAQRRLRRAGCKPYYLACAEVQHRVLKQQVDPDWILKRRRRSGRELGLIIADRQRPASSPGKRAMLALTLRLLKLKHRLSYRVASELQDFARQWWDEYRQGAYEILSCTKTDEC
ncbi:glycosyltransferase family 2 protein [Planctomycetaceae bacterium SH139]